MTDINYKQYVEKIKDTLINKIPVKSQLNNVDDNCNIHLFYVILKGIQNNVEEELKNTYMEIAEEIENSITDEEQQLLEEYIWLYQDVESCMNIDYFPSLKKSSVFAEAVLSHLSSFCKYINKNYAILAPLIKQCYAIELLKNPHGIDENYKNTCPLFDDSIKLVNSVIEEFDLLNTIKSKSDYDDICSIANTYVTRKDMV